MTNSEFSNEFDILYNNIMSNQAPGIDEYEKSVFLTKAQDEIVKAYFNPKGNKFLEGFDGSEKRQMDFSMIIATKNITVTGNNTDGAVATMFGINSGVYKVETSTTTDRIMMILNETVKVTNNDKSKYLTVVPLSYTELARGSMLDPLWEYTYPMGFDLGMRMERKWPETEQCPEFWSSFNP